MSTQLKRPIIIFSALALMCAVGAVAAAMAIASHPTTTHHRAQYHAASARLRRAFSVLDARSVAARSAAATAEPLPGAVATVMPQKVSGTEPAAAVFAGSTYPAWVVPGASKVCLVAGSTGPTSVPGSTCAELAWAEQHGIAIVTEDANGTPVIFGLAPNGNTSVEVTETDGSTKSVSVTNNVYEIVGGSPKTVRLKGLSGASWDRTVGPLPAPPAESKPSQSRTP
jgi:hypothetical protein